MPRATLRRYSSQATLRGNPTLSDGEDAVRERRKSAEVKQRAYLMFSCSMDSTTQKGRKPNVLTK